MMELTISEENYLKAMYKLVLENQLDEISSTDISAALHVKPASVSNMLSKFRDKGLVHLQRYGKVYLSKAGKLQGRLVLRKHRIWETFLHDKLSFDWDEVHDVAEQLEHIRSPKLIDALDKMLGFPKFDPHGECIPQSDGSIPCKDRLCLLQAKERKAYTISGVRNSNDKMLQYLIKLGLAMQTPFQLLGRIDFDGSLELQLENGHTVIVSEKLADNIYIEEGV